MIFVGGVIIHGAACGVDAGVIRLVINEQEREIRYDFVRPVLHRNGSYAFEPSDDVLKYAFVLFDNEEPRSDFRRNTEIPHIALFEVSILLYPGSAVRHDGGILIVFACAYNNLLIVVIRREA